MQTKEIGMKKNLFPIFHLLVVILCTLLVTFFRVDSLEAQCDIDTNYSTDYFKGTLEIKVTADGQWDNLEVQCNKNDNDINKFQSSPDIWGITGFIQDGNKNFVKLKRNEPTTANETVVLSYWGNDKNLRGKTGRIIITMNNDKLKDLPRSSMCSLVDAPTLTEWGLIIFITTVLGIGVVILYRRRIA